MWKGKKWGWREINLLNDNLTEEKKTTGIQKTAVVFFQTLKKSKIFRQALIIWAFFHQSYNWSNLNSLWWLQHSAKKIITSDWKRKHRKQKQKCWAVQFLAQWQHPRYQSTSPQTSPHLSTPVQEVINCHIHFKRQIVASCSKVILWYNAKPVYIYQPPSARSH